MKFLYGTIPGRLLLKILLNSGVLRALAGWCQSPGSKWLIRRYIRKNQIDMSAFEGQEYNSFADFFVRKKGGTVFESAPDVLIAPCDGMLSIVQIRDGAYFTVKGSDYLLTDLVPDRALADRFADGLCMIYRLRASDYHHFCYIDDCYHGKGQLIPGELHSVQPIALEREPVFRKNRRMWSVMDTKHFGIVAQIEVGAVLVGGIVHVSGETNVKRGDEMGYFELCGSTIILLFSREVGRRLQLTDEIAGGLEQTEEVEVKMGQGVGKLTM